MANLRGNRILDLLRRPEELGMLRQNPAPVDTVIEELLRFDSQHSQLADPLQIKRAPTPMFLGLQRLPL
jgi:cytochrome P450